MYLFKNFGIAESLCVRRSKLLRSYPKCPNVNNGKQEHEQTYKQNVQAEEILRDN